MLYYYEDLHDLLQQVYEATRRYSVQREDAIGGLTAPAQRLGTALRMTVPTGPEDRELRILFEFDAMIFGNPQYIEFAREYLDRHVQMYEDVPLAGSRRARSP